MKKELLKILGKLVSYRTVKGNGGAMRECLDYVSEELKELGWVEKSFMSGGKESRVWLSEDTLEPEVLLNAHVDVVPASDGMFEMRKSGGKLYGRGVSDMKFAVASFIVALKKLKQMGELKGRFLGLMLNTDEELGGVDGVGYLVNEVRFRPGLVLIPDGGDNWRMVASAKGVLRLVVKAGGKTAHSSKPWEGESAIDKLGRFMVSLRREFPEVGVESQKTTVNIGKINGGVQNNQVSSEAEMWLDVRYAANEGKEKVLGRIRKVSDEVEVQVDLQADAFVLTNKQHPLVVRWRDMLLDMGEKEVYMNEHSASDGRYFSAKGIPVILSKPDGGLIHTENEWIGVEGIVKYTNVLVDWLK